jgi:hypothetical protein
LATALIPGLIILIAIFIWVVAAQWRRGHEPSNRRLLWTALASLAIGVAPIIANILSDEVAKWLGCYIAEFSIYDRRGTFDDTYDDVSGCHGVGALLVIAHTLVFAFIFTWPFILLSLFLWIVLLVRLVRRPNRSAV